MQRISVTTLEKFRRYMNSVSSFDTEESLLESILGIFKGNDKTKFGAGYHKIIEGEFVVAKSGLLVNVDNDQLVYSLPVAQAGIDYKKAHPAMVHEMKASKVYDTSFFPIQVSARIDGMEGIFVRDIKTKFRAPVWLEYFDSCQWKLYLDMMGLDHFYYDLFEICGFTELPHNIPRLIKDVTVIPHEPYGCDRYEGMESDIMSILNDFLEYLHMKGLVHHLKPAILEDEPFNF